MANETYTSVCDLEYLNAMYIPRMLVTIKPTEATTKNQRNDKEWRWLGGPSVRWFLCTWASVLIQPCGANMLPFGGSCSSNVCSAPENARKIISGAKTV